MRVHAVSDVHGATAALARAGDGADALICLGDLVLFLDYDDHSGGIFAELFGAANAAEFVRLRTARRFDEASALGTRLWDRVCEEHGRGPRAPIERMVRGQYAELFAAMPEPAYLTYGNVDVPAYWTDYLRPGHQVLDGGTADIGGLRFGFVGGGLVSPMRTPYELTEASSPRRSPRSARSTCCAATSRRRCPSSRTTSSRGGSRPAAGRCWSTCGARQPRAMIFGHVHQPAASRMRIGRTECVNVGHFRGSGTPFALQW